MRLDKYSKMCIHCYSVMQNSFTALKILCAPCLFIPVPPQLPETTRFIVSTVLPLSVSYNWDHTIRSLSSCFLSLRDIHLRFPHVSVAS